ncbi:hypothetical protein ACFW04_005116 [Cataglyphis niger]
MGLNPILPFRNYSSILKITSRARDDIFAQNDNSESENEFTSNSDDYTSSNDDSRENINEYYNRSSYMLFTPTLEDLKNVLYVALNPFFEELEIEVVSCPCLIKAPYNLAAAGLSGNTSILELGTFDYFYPNPRTDFAFNIRYILSRCNNDVFVIGSGFAAQPCMPYNGHLTMNAVVSANSTNIINNSCIAYEVVANELKLQIINDPNQIKCSLFGNFFLSDGKRGPVIKLRAKGRRSRSNITALIQKALANRCQKRPLIGLGIVLVINGGLTVQYLLPHNFVSSGYNRLLDYYSRITPYSFTCINLIALGALISKNLDFCGNEITKMFLRDETSMFNALPNFESFGNFLNDLTPDDTEYIVYINIAQKRTVSK